MHLDTSVIIVGGGPVGLVAAADLNARGINSIVIEQRPFMLAPHVKSNHVSARTMERFRQLGFATKVRDAGLPADYPNDVAFRTTLTGKEITRIFIPSREERYTSTTGADSSWATPEPPHRINQRFLEPVLMEHVATLPHVTLLNETEFLKFEQDDAGVTAFVRTVNGEEKSIRGSYMIGADGSRSLVRKAIGAKFHGDAVLSYVQSTCIRAEGLYDLMPGAPAWGYYTFNHRRNGHVYSIDGESVFLVHNYTTPEETEKQNVDRDWAIREILGVSEDFTFEKLSTEDWVARRLVADTFRDRRVFIAGDASHLWVPYAGYGMNAGVADGLNLTWLLGAVLSGWADPSILDTYEAERLPITDQVSRFAMGHLRKITANDIPAEIEDDSAAGETARAEFGKLVYDLNVEQFAAEGLNFGYSYDHSPIISYDSEIAPSYTMSEYVPSTVPGCRAPHFWLEDGVSLYDRLGLYYTVIARDDANGIEDFMREAEKSNLPVELIIVPAVKLPNEYTQKFTLVRQDQHVVWRGEGSATDTASELVSRLRGASPVTASASVA